MAKRVLLFVSFLLTVSSFVSAEPPHKQSQLGYPWQPFQQVTRPALPQVKDAGHVLNPIDSFIAAEREASGLTARPEASRHLLLRRVYLDLIGLQPTPDELQTFLEDQSPDAYEKVVDRLLAAPQEV